MAKHDPKTAGLMTSHLSCTTRPISILVCSRLNVCELQIVMTRGWGGENLHEVDRFWDELDV